MKLLNFEGEINDISERQLEFISEVLEKRGYKNETVSVQSVGKAGDNYIASVKRITVKKDGETFNMIAKVAPQHEAIRATMSTLIMFLNEHTMYTEVLPKFAELEKSAEVPVNERLRFAQCYGSLSEAPNEVILIEDLGDSNFTMLDKLTPLSNNTVRMVLKNFAILHSLSFYLKKQEPETFTAYSSKLINTWALMDGFEETKIYFNQLEADVLDMLESPKHKNAFKGLVSEIPSNATKNEKIDKTSKYSVIQQGDSWTNNIMFRMQVSYLPT